MPTLLDLLYQYAQEQRMGAALSAAGPDFHAACRLAEKARTELEGLLEGREAQLLSSYLDHRDQAELEVERAMLRCGVSIGLELGRL